MAARQNGLRQPHAAGGARLGSRAREAAHRPGPAGILGNPELKIFQQPWTKAIGCGFFSFGDRLEPGPNDPDKIKTWLKQLKADAPSTHLGEALQQAAEAFSGQPIAGVVLLTDEARFQRRGRSPARRGQGCCVSPFISVPIGLPRPDDVRIGLGHAARGGLSQG